MKLYWIVLTVKATLRRWWMMACYVFSNCRGEGKLPAFNRNAYSQEDNCMEMTVGKTTYQVYSFHPTERGKEISELLLKLIAAEQGG